jgi:hypothetical protein
MKCDNTILKKITSQLWYNIFFINKQMAQVCHLPKPNKCIP